ncbi:MAG: Flp family type IVb pilin, partial [Isosphaeraceae bacterium]
LAAPPPSDRRCRPTGGHPPPARSGRQSGQGLIEYGVVLVLMAVVCVVSLVFFGDQLSSLLSMITSAV